MRAGWRRCAPAAGVMVLAFLVAMVKLGDRSLWGDEAFSVAVARAPAAEFWRVLAEGQANMALYYLLLRPWIGFGISEATVRLLSVLAATGAVGVLYVLAGRLFDRRTALMTAIIVALNGFFVRYAQEARSYALVVLLVCLATYLLVRLHQDHPSRTTTAAYVVVSALAVYAHFFAAFVVVAHGVTVLVAGSGRELRQQVLRTLAVAVLCSPLALFIVTEDEGQISHVGRSGIVDVVRALRELAGGSRILLVVVCLLGLGFLVVAWRQAGRGRTRSEQWPWVLSLAWLAVPIAGAFVVSFVKPMFVPRYLIVTLPALGLIAGRALAALPLRAGLAGLAGIVAVNALNLPYRSPSYEYENFRGASSYVLASAQPGDGIVFYRPARRIPFEYYRERTRPAAAAEPVHPPAGWGRFDLIDDYRATAAPPQLLDRLKGVAAQRRLWVVLSDPANETQPAKREAREAILAAIGSTAGQVEQRSFAGLEVRLFEPPPPPA